MKGLWMSEWLRLWSRKRTWGMFLMMPVLVYAAARYCLEQNGALSPGMPEYATVWNFPVLALAEHLMTVFNLLVVVLLAAAVTEEARSGQLRFLLLRAVTFAELFWAKWTVVLAAVGVFLGAFYLECWGIGWWLFERTETVGLFYREGAFAGGEAVRYGLAYYGLAGLTVVAMASVMLLLAVMAQTATAAVGMGIGWLLLSFGWPVAARMFGAQVQSLSITHIQHQGIAAMLADGRPMMRWNLGVMVCYVAVCLTVGYLWFVKRRGLDV
ncbi:hypothetical protein OS242_05180 [Tumebacillus sp. DT12]|uniref:ABC transporter permease n=1 Tax=Tumebacillus lacus TaxID=2995335 RepID=A0ABT3WXE0_9BACL|nr:ABC transporter permease subunit [Tumebacillus lacus]MCX7569345.1 hypothetical protein [Tumebacillus lacus]